MPKEIEPKCCPATEEIINNQKAEIDRLRYIIVNFMSEVFDWGNKHSVDTSIFAQLAILGKEKDSIVKQLKVDAITEFVMNLPMTPGIFHYLDERDIRANTVVVFVHDIDRLAEKMTGNKFRQCKAEYYKKIDHNSLCETETYERGVQSE